MKVKLKQQIKITGALIGALVMAVGLTYFSEAVIANNKYQTLEKETLKNNSIVSQKVIGESNELQTVKKMYYQDRLVGVIHDFSNIQRLLDERKADYAEAFPNSTLQLGEDIFVLDEDTYFQYEDVDHLIQEFIVTNDLFAVEAIRVDFSNGASIYVKDVKDFEEARDAYLLNFISQEDLNTISQGGLPPDIPNSQNSGMRTVGYNIVETTSYTKGYASKNNILMNKNDIVSFLSYGFNTEKKEYTVVEYDTVAGVGGKTGLSAQQIVTINSDKLLSTEQVLKVGETLNVTYFNSPINITVTKERVGTEIVYPESTLYVADPTMREGTQKVVTEERTGLRRVKYKETYINGILQDNAVLLESRDLSQPVREVIHYGTMVIPGIGSGNFRYPVDNPVVTCGWYCYSGHRATDFINRYVPNGAPILAADRGVVAMSSYSSVNGYYIWIDHQNGYRTYYGHMRAPALYSAGTTVMKGEVIGYMGRTGVASGVHVHFVIEHQGTRINPCLLLGC